MKLYLALWEIRSPWVRICHSLSSKEEGTEFTSTYLYVMD